MLPTVLVITAEDLVKQFLEDASCTFTTANLIEMITQVLNVFLNPACVEKGMVQQLPNFELLFNPLWSLEDRENIVNACFRFSRNLHNRLHFLGLYEEHGFSYVFDRLIGKDIMLDYLPY